MDEPGFCFNCFLSPTIFALKLMGIDIMHTCQIDFTQSKLYKAYQCCTMISTWIAVIWSIYVSLIDKNTCIEYCGGFLYAIPDSKTSINLTKIFTVGASLMFAICVTISFFSKKIKIQSRQENYEGEIAFMTKVRNWINLLTCIVCCWLSININLIVILTAKETLLPENMIRHIICQTVYQIMIFWLLITLCNIAGIITIHIVFMTCRFKNISERFKNFRKNPYLMKELLYLEEFKHSELCEIIEKLDNAYGNVITIIALCCMLSDACCFYYAIFGLHYERIIFLILGFGVVTITIGECLLCATIQDYAMDPIHELYIFALYPLEREDLIKVITFMKRININEYGLHYFRTVLYSKEFALEMLNTVWSYLSTLRQFRDITKENYSSTICNQTINIMESIT